MQRRGFLNSLLGLPVAVKVAEARPTTVEQPKAFLALDGKQYEVIDGYTEHRQVPIPEPVARFMTVKTRERICGTFNVKGMVTAEALTSPMTVMESALVIPSMKLETYLRLWITSLVPSGSGKNRTTEISYQILP